MIKIWVRRIGLSLFESFAARAFARALTVAALVFGVPHLPSDAHAQTKAAPVTPAPSVGASNNGASNTGASSTGATSAHPLTPPSAATSSPPTSPEIAALIKTALELWTNGRYKVEEVRRTPLAGMYEARIGSDLFYVDEKANYIFLEGNMIELKTNRNFTKERLEEVLAVNFKDLPLDMAIKQVNGKGTHKIALFEDPNCGYCKKLRADLNQMQDLTVYTFAYPILAADSDVKSKKAWCAKDRQKAWNELMTQGKVPDNPGTCANPVDKIKELGRKYNITATPTVFLTNGKRIQGYMPAEQFAKLVATSN